AAKTRTNRCAAMLRTGDDLKFQFLSKSDFGGVVAVKRDALEYHPEISLQLRVALAHHLRRARSAGVFGHRGVIHGAQKCGLLRGGSIDKTFSEKIVALLVDSGKAAEEIGALFLGSPFREDQVDEFVDQRGFGARCI